MAIYKQKLNFKFNTKVKHKLSYIIEIRKINAI